MVHDLGRDGPEEHRLPTAHPAMADDDEIGLHLTGLVDDDAPGTAPDEDRLDDEITSCRADLTLGDLEGIAVDLEDLALEVVHVGRDLRRPRDSEQVT